MLKRLFDVIVSVLALLVASPLLLLLAALIRVKLGSPILFGQIRPGRLGHPFRMIKFRTMVDTLNREGNLLPDSERITTVGRWLRNSSLDELPELWNVLKGDMSLVGPRPLLMQYMDRYTAEQARRHEVRPGVTGWAQVNGRNAITWDEKFKLDVWYVDNQSFWLDCKILWMTIVQVLQRKDISADGHATMPEFMGSNDGHKR
ncbi:MAG: sugar transferase [Burkholderiaceae bacterium]